LVTSATPPEIRVAYVPYRRERQIAPGTDFIRDPNFLDT
jgi:hypothetical protein